MSQHLRDIFTEEEYQCFNTWSYAWLKQQDNNNSISPEEMNKSISRKIALSLINYLDDNRYKGAINMSSIECEDLENSILDSDWSKVYRYMRKKLEKQEQNKWHKIEDGDLPKENGDYLIVCKDTNIEQDISFYEIAFYTGKDWDKSCFDDVVAWRELPEYVE